VKVSLRHFELRRLNAWTCVACFVVLVAYPAAAQQPSQVPDDDFAPAVAEPAYLSGGPTVAIDGAHHNLHTAEGGFRPFAELLRRDGYTVTGSNEPFTERALASVDVLVIANALAGDARTDASSPAFTADECDAVLAWVKAGGSLLLIADHRPFGSASAVLAERFGVDFGEGYVADPLQSRGAVTTLHFASGAGLLAAHPISRGRSQAERVVEVLAFTGQSLSVPPGATAILSLSASAVELETADALQGYLSTGDGAARPVGHRAVLMAMPFGEGRVVVAGEAAMFTAQIFRSASGSEMPFGLNTPGTSNQQLVLNVLHWLSGALPDE